MDLNVEFMGQSMQMDLNVKIHQQQIWNDLKCI
jgi:hypothetical protein